MSTTTGIDWAAFHRATTPPRGTTNTAINEAPFPTGSALWVVSEILRVLGDTGKTGLSDLPGLVAAHWPDWRPIATVPTGDEIFMAATADGRLSIFRGSILANMRRPDTPNHLQFPATHWLPLPPAPTRKDAA